MSAPLLVVNDLRKSFHRRSLFGAPDPHPAVDGLSFELDAGATLGIVGESGSGKSTVARLIAGLMPSDEGSIRFAGIDLGRASGASLRALRQDMQMVFQDSAGSLNPKLTLGRTIALQAMAKGVSESEARRDAHRMLDQVGLPSQNYFARFPHQLSGGQRQRVNIARALVVRPRLLILDEPVSALDKTVEAQIVRLLVQLRSEYDFSCLFISHDLSITRALCDRVQVMYQGRIVEQGATSQVLGQPQHPYTAMLLAAQLSEDPTRRRLSDFVLAEQASARPIAPQACRFTARCPLAASACASERSHLLATTRGHASACLQATHGRHLVAQNRWSA